MKRLVMEDMKRFHYASNLAPFGADWARAVAARIPENKIFGADKARKKFPKGVYLST